MPHVETESFDFLDLTGNKHTANNARKTHLAEWNTYEEEHED